MVKSSDQDLLQQIYMFLACFCSKKTLAQLHLTLLNWFSESLCNMIYCVDCDDDKMDFLHIPTTANMALLIGR